MKAKLEAINEMSRDEAIQYLKAIHLSSIQGRERTLLLETCEDRINQLNRDAALVTVSVYD